MLSALIADCSREDDKTLYEKWLEVAGWNGVDEVTALARKTFNAKDDTNIAKMNKLDRGVPGPFFGDRTRLHLTRPWVVLLLMLSAFRAA